MVQVGGLGAAVAGLVSALRQSGVVVDVVVPDYAGEPLTDEVVTLLDVPGFAGPARARTGTHATAGPITLIECAGIARSHPYVQPSGDGWWDNDNRFFSFSAAIAAWANVSRPSVVHLNDWHTAATPAFLQYDVPTVLTIHTAGYQGVTNRGWLAAFPRRAHLYQVGGDCNPLVGGVLACDTIITVSPNYAHEITMGDDALAVALRSRGSDFLGIRNGIDARIWNPGRDRALAKTFTWRSLRGKDVCRAALHAELGLRHDDRPLVVAVSRLVEQKGIDLLLPLVPLLHGLGARLAVLGAGEASLVRRLSEAVDRYEGDATFVAGYDNGLAHRLFAGGDLFVMPSRFEPCGLAQMQAMAYGTIPVVTDVGGLHDTVADADADPTGGNGFVAASVDSTHLVDALHRSVRAWRSSERRVAIMRRGMRTDWSWNQPAADHVARYDALRSPLGETDAAFGIA